MRTVLALVLPLLLAAQSALLQIKVVEGEGARFALGARTPGLAVEITDEMGRPVAGAVVSIRLPDDGPGGSFANGLSSEILSTGSNGRATTSPVRWSRVPGRVEIRITAVKGQLRAGTVAACELSGAVRGKAGTAAQPEPSVRKRLPVKWLVLGAVAAAAAAGFASGRAGGTNNGSGAGPGSGGGSGPGSNPIQIGSPSITIGKP